MNVTWGPELIREYERTGLTPETAAQYVVLSRIYGGAIAGGSFFTGLALVLLGAMALRGQAPGRAFGAAAIFAGAFDVAAVVKMLPPALPLTGAVLVWLGLSLWRGDASPGNNA